MTVKQHAAQAGTQSWVLAMVLHMQGWTEDQRVSLQEYSEAAAKAEQHEVRQQLQAEPLAEKEEE